MSARTETWMRALRAARQLLVSRGMCGEWLPLQPTVCALHAGHTSPCGKRGTR